MDIPFTGADDVDKSLSLVKLAISPPEEGKKSSEKSRTAFNKKLKEFVEQAKATIDQLPPVTPEARETAKLTNGCVRCDKEGKKLSLCSKCKHAAYCSRECQKADWPKHKRYCKAPDPEAEVFESKTLTLSTRAMAVDVICSHILYLAHRMLSLSTHPHNSHTFVIFFTWDLVPLQTPKEWFNATPAKPGTQRYMLKLESVEIKPRVEIERGMLEMLKSRRHPLRVAGVISEPEHLFVDVVFACERSKDMYKVAGYSRTFWPDVRKHHKRLDAILPQQMAGIMESTGMSFEHCLIKHINQTIVLDTQNVWKLRTRLQHDD